MFLCYFALSSATTANMMEQTKEIGVLRAIGMKKSRVYILYLYETFIMIFTGCITGILVGTTIGWTMMLQRVLFTNVPIPFYFPWMQMIVMFFISGVCAFLATIFPAHNILKREISDIFRTN
jgi:ABC-type antimicrobial peptide transport system permease subunit